MTTLIDRIVSAESAADGDLKALLADCAQAVRERDAMRKGIDRVAAMIPPQTPEQLASAERLKAASLDRGTFPGARSRL